MPETSIFDGSISAPMAPVSALLVTDTTRDMVSESTTEVVLETVPAVISTAPMDLITARDVSALACLLAAASMVPVAPATSMPPVVPAQDPPGSLLASIVPVAPGATHPMVAEPVGTDSFMAVQCNLPPVR